MPRISKKLMLSTSMAVPLALSGLVIAAPRVLADPLPARAAHDKSTPMQKALFAAVSDRQIDQVRALLGQGIDPNFQIPGDGTPLIIAAGHGDIETAGLLLDHGAKIDKLTRSDETALINAVRGNHLPMVEFLIGRGADASLGMVANPVTQPEWRSPLSEAHKYDHTEIVNYLQAVGAQTGTAPKIKKSGANETIVKGKLTSNFGVIRTKFGGEKHKGVDIANTSGTPIYAPANGVITQVTNAYKGNAKWGKVVVLESEGHVETVFAHLLGSNVKVGDNVDAGMQIAQVGNTGKSTGPHVHIQTSVKGELIDPLTVWPTLAR